MINKAGDETVGQCIFVCAFPSIGNLVVILARKMQCLVAYNCPCYRTVCILCVNLVARLHERGYVNVCIWRSPSEASIEGKESMRLLYISVCALLCGILAVAIYVKASGTLASGVTLSIVGGESTCNEYADISCVISNGTASVISFFKVYDDGFGYSLEWQEGGNWMTSGVMWCATGRDVVKLNAGEVYSFKAKAPLDHCKRRLSVEYWDGEPLVSAPKQVKSEPFVCVTNNCSFVR